MACQKDCCWFYYQRTFTVDLGFWLILTACLLNAQDIISIIETLGNVKTSYSEVLGLALQSISDFNNARKTPILCKTPQAWISCWHGCTYFSNISTGLSYQAQELISQSMSGSRHTSDTQHILLVRDIGRDAATMCRLQTSKFLSYCRF